jgi:hypothetical protein
VDADGWSFWATPKSPDNIGWEGLFRFDHLDPDQSMDGRRDRVIAGISYWFPHQGGVSTAVMFDFENVDNKDVPTRPDERRYAVHALLNF